MTPTPQTDQYKELLLEIFQVIYPNNRGDFQRADPRLVGQLQALIQYIEKREVEARIYEVKNAYNLMQSYLMDGMESDDATYQLQVDLRERIRGLKGDNHD